jgi:hypothetical protein
MGEGRGDVPDSNTGETGGVRTGPAGAQPVGTRAEHYGARYYATDCGLEYDWASPHWRSFFDGVATRLVALFQPATALDAGCAKGILVGSLVDAGVDAHGIDISPVAVEHSDPRAARRLREASLTEPIEGHYDLVTCIEVIEHMSQPDAELALDSICAVTDLVVLSSSPWDLREATHVNVRPTGHWAAMMLDRGFVRRFDVDLSFITPWAIAFERRPVNPRELVSSYESTVSRLASEVGEKRQALLETQGKLAEASPSVEHGKQVLELRDTVRGLEAAHGTAVRRSERLQGELDSIRAQLDAERAQAEIVRCSPTWKIGRFVTAPLRAVRALVRGLR